MSDLRLSPAPLMFEAALRAFAYCFHPRVIFLSLLPLLLAAVSLSLLSYWGWEAGLNGLRAALDHWDLSRTMLEWLDRAGLSALRTALVPVLLLMLVVPVVIMACLLLVGALMTPAIVKLVKARRFSDLEPVQAVPWWQALAWSLGSTLLALGVLVLSLPLWLMPLLAAVLPPLIWGWLTYRVMAYDTLADVATPAERDALMQTHRRPLLVMGIVTGYLGAAPTALWALGVMTVFLAPFLLVIAIWIYTLIFAFSSLWFANYLLPLLRERRRAGGGIDITPSRAGSA